MAGSRGPQWVSSPVLGLFQGMRATGKQVLYQALGHEPAHKHQRETNTQNKGIPFKELQVLWRRPQLLEAGGCPHTGMVVHQVLEVGVDLQSKQSHVRITEGLPKSLFLEAPGYGTRIDMSVSAW